MTDGTSQAGSEYDDHACRNSNIGEKFSTIIINGVISAQPPIPKRPAPMPIKNEAVIPNTGLKSFFSLYKSTFLLSSYFLKSVQYI